MSGGSFRLDQVRTGKGTEEGEFGGPPEVASLAGIAGQQAEVGATAELAEFGGAPGPAAEVADLRAAGDGVAGATTVSAAELAVGTGPVAERSATVADLARMIGRASRASGVGKADDRRRAARSDGGSGTVAERRRPRPVDYQAAEPHPEHETGSRAERRKARSERAAEQARAAIEADPVGVAREICLRLLTDRARTRQELAQALQRKGIPDEAAEAVLSRFDEVGLIDDAAFAGQWVRSRHRARGLSRRAIAVELRRKGIDDEVAEEALEEVDPAAEEARAHDLVVKKLRSMAVTTAEEQQSAARRLVGMLARKGYGAGVAYGVVRRALAERGAELEEEIHPDG
ncbi:regulatory protein RecX [Pseudonocardia sp. CA-107938]|uniref:regulatory protein RecX n=1 Tax=Pseudonocardia sp. CA-107938 TaxID=3240021 RepID=UPI003D930988